VRQTPTVNLGWLGGPGCGRGGVAVRRGVPDGGDAGWSGRGGGLAGAGVVFGLV